jgi:branched-subunit amino acid transport protein AzlD
MAEDPDSPWPELAAVLLVAVVQWFSRNALLSIGLGTGIYVLLRNFT